MMLATKQSMSTTRFPSLLPDGVRASVRIGIVTIAICAMMVLAEANLARADGMIQSLPADGSWVRFNLRATNENQGAAKEVFVGTLTVKSVGCVQVNGVACRWFEFDWELHDEVRGAPHSAIEKWLIPEAQIGADKSPRLHAVRAWAKWNEEQVETKDVSNAFLDDLLLPDTLRDRKFEELPRTIEYQNGRLEVSRCILGVTTGATSDGISKSTARHQYWICEMIPFGVAAATQTQEIVVNGVTITNRFESTLEMNDYGTGAVSSIPGHE